MKKEALLPKLKRMIRSHIELKLIFFAVLTLFLFFLAAPIAMLLLKSFQSSGGAFWTHYIEVFTRSGFWSAVGNSFLAAGGSALITTVLAFLLAYTIHYTNLPHGFLKIIRTGAVLPMLLPTITYGFALIYTFGKQGLLTRILGHQLFPIYGLPGLLIGYVIYTLPVAFLLIHNTMGYIDKKFMVVSALMGDKKSDTFFITILRPLTGTLAASFIQSFFLAFTDFGIPASVGGQYEVLASLLYDEMLGSIPDFNKGAVIDKKEKTNPLAMEMAECIVKYVREELQETYPNPLYEGETVNEANQSAYPSKFPEPLTADLLAGHQEFSERCKK